ncbi:MAG: mechanosensitive ion channel domain-containing protein [Pseudomonadota bacterium]
MNYSSFINYQPYSLQRSIVMVTIFIVLLSFTSLHAEEQAAVTTANPEIPVAELNWLLKPLTVEELEVEANAWQSLLRQKSMEISDLNIKLLEQKEDREERADDEGKIIGKDEPTENEVRQKENIVEELTVLNEERTIILNNTQAAVDAFEAKGGDEAKVLSYRKYLEVTGGATVDISDTQAVMAFAQNWITSEEGGLRWLINISKFVITVIAFYFLACLLGKAVRHALDKTSSTSELMRNFLIAFVRRITIVVGIIVGLAALEVDIGPLLAVIGAAGFVIAFALQSSLANFASGILIMMFRPFDVEDVVEVAGVSGKIKSVSLLSTQMTTFDNKALVIPNNEVWGGVITNYTATGKRRVDMVFGIGYDDDIDQTQTILEEIVSKHDKVLKDPEPVIRVHELADSSVNFIVRPWVNSDDYWDVFWDVTHEVKNRLDAEGISIPFPQQDVHVYNEALPSITNGSNKVGEKNPTQSDADFKKTTQHGKDHADTSDNND